MKVGTLCGLLVVCLDLSLYFTPAESFSVPISVSTGMAIIVALVKIKAIIVKVLLGLRAMGIDGFVWRRRRRRRETSEIITENSVGSFHQDFLNIWNDLQLTVGKVIQFDMDACIAGAQVSNREKTSLPWERETFPGYLERNTSQSVKTLSNDPVYSSWVSRTLGSITGDPLACQVVLELSKIKQPSVISSTNSSEEQKISDIHRNVGIINSTADDADENRFPTSTVRIVPLSLVKLSLTNRFARYKLNSGTR